MPSANPVTTFDEYLLRARGRLSTARETIKAYRDMAGAAPHWNTGYAVQAECRAAIELLDKMTERLDRKLVVTLIGPSGAGKSTLLNALSGDDRLSRAGDDRPTTKEVVVFCRSRSDADLLLSGLAPDTVSLAQRPSAAGLEHIILVDTPDMDSTESEKFHPVLEKTLALTDVLVCVLNAENPKRRDTIVFLERFVDFFPGSALYVVLNRCDRLPEDELKAAILPDLRNHLEASWQREVDRIFCISARSHLNDPHWPEDEKPFHDFDQYPQLRDLIYGTLSRGGRFVDTRVERADHLVELVRRSVRANVAAVKDRLIDVRKDILALEQKATTAATAALKETGAQMLTGIQALFYQNLAGRWWGPVGWLVALWARFLMAGAGVVATLRFGNPVLQLWGLVSSLVRYRKTRSAVEEAATGGEMAPVMLKYRFTLQQTWPDIADKLIALGFNGGVRDAAAVLPDEKALQQHLSAAWKSKMEAVMEQRAASVSGFFLQLLFNLPTLAVMGLFAFQSVKNFLLQSTLSSGYFLHAAVSVLMVWLLSFVLFQVIVRFASGRNLLDRTFRRLVDGVDPDDSELLSRSIVTEIDAVLRLSDV